MKHLSYYDQELMGQHIDIGQQTQLPSLYHHHQRSNNASTGKYSNQQTTTIIRRKRKRASGFQQPTGIVVVNLNLYLYFIVGVYLTNQCRMSSSWLVLHRMRSFHLVSKSSLTPLQTKLRQRLHRTTSSSPFLQRPLSDVEPRCIGSSQLRYSTTLKAKRKSTTIGDDDHITTKAKASSKRQSSSSSSSSSETSKRSLSTSSAAVLVEESTEELVLISTTTVMKARKKKSSSSANTTTPLTTPSVSTVFNGTSETTSADTTKTKKVNTKVKPKASTPSYLQQLNQTVPNTNTTTYATSSHSQTVTTNTTVTNQPVADMNYSYVPDGVVMFPSMKSFSLPQIQPTTHTCYADNNNNNMTNTNTNISIDIDTNTGTGPEYIVISRTPIATTVTNDTVASIDDSSVTNDTLLTSNGPSTSTICNDDNIAKLLNPYDLIPPNATTGEWKIPYPKALSPSSIKEFQACPQSFLFQYILGLRQPTTTVLAKGTMCHSALERIFDIEPQDRSLPVLQNLFRTVWSEQRTTDMYRILFEEDVLIDHYYNDDDDQNDLAANTITTGSSSIPQVQPLIERRRYIQKEITWGQEGLQLLRNYWSAEDASSILRPNPVQREVWVKSNLQLLTDDGNHVLNTNTDGTKIVIPKPLTITSNQTIEPLDVNSIEVPTNVSGSMFFDNNNTNTTVDDSNITNMNTTSDSNVTKFLVRGIVDRLDMVQDPKNKSQISLRLIDYKTGKAPDLKYSPSMNTKIQNEAFDQLLIYALLLRESNRHKTNPMPLRYLRLFYLTSIHEDGKAIYWDMDLGETQEERDMILHTVHVSLSNVYRNICQLIDAQNFLAFQGCQRSFCYCHKCRPKFVPGTVWEPPISS
jgi:hypothetical protein